MRGRDLAVANGWLVAPHTTTGWPTRDIAYAQVRNISGPKTAAAVLGGTAAFVLTLPAMPAVWVPFLLPEDHPDIVHPDVMSERGDWTPQVPLALDAPTPLFDHGAYRRARLTIAASAELGIDTLHGRTVLDGGFATVRVHELVEVGFGGLHLGVHTSDGWWNGGLFMMRMGFHIPVDHAHRVSIPLTFDVGGGGGEAVGAVVRLRTGLEVRVSDRASITLTPLAPTYLNWKHGSMGDVPKGSYTTSLELGLAF